MRRPSFHPPPPAPPDPPEPQLQLYDKPDDQILLHGEMIRDNATIEQILQGLPFAGQQYRGNLRVVISAAMRIRDVCLALLGEMSPKAPPSKPSIKVDDSDRSLTIDDPDPDDLDGVGPRDHKDPDPPPARKNGRRAPKKTGKPETEPAGRKPETRRV